MERETGIEPAPSAWKAEVLPLNYSRNAETLASRKEVDDCGRPALRPSGAAPLRVAFRIAPAIRSNPRSLSVVRTHLRRTPCTHSSWWREVDDCGRPALRPPGAAPLRVAFRIAPAIRSNPRSLSVVRTHLRRTPCTHSSWWREVDSNHRRREPADLQSAPVGRLGIPPARSPAFSLPGCPKSRRNFAVQRVAAPTSSGLCCLTSASMVLDSSPMRWA